MQAANHEPIGWDTAYHYEPTPEDLGAMAADLDLDRAPAWTPEEIAAHERGWRLPPNHLDLPFGEF